MIKQPKFSIVMPVYNVADYIAEALDSLINQDIGFLDNVQIILVNDGSTDNSREICEDYVRRYPDNIELINKENGGSSSARNQGLKHAEGELVNFLDPDDMYTPTVLSSVWQFWRRNKLFVDTVSVPLYFFEARSGIHSKYQLMGSRNRVIDLDKEPYNFVLSSASTFYRLSIIGNRKFDTNLRWGEDANFNAKIIINTGNRRIGYVCENNVKYMYRIRKKGDSSIDLTNCNPDYAKSIQNIMPKGCDYSVPFVKELYVYLGRLMLAQCYEDTFSSADDYNKTMALITSSVSSLGLDFIEHGSKWLDDFRKKAIFVKLAGASVSAEFTKGNLPFDIDVRLIERKISNDELTVDVLFNGYGCPIDVVAYDGSSRVYQPASSEDINSPYDVEYGSVTLSNTSHRIFKLSLKKNQVIKFCFINTETMQYIPIRHVRLFGKSKLILRNNKCGIRYKKKLITFNGRKIKIANYNTSTLAHNLRTILDIREHYNYTAFARLFSKRTKRYILISDRPNKADDNGEALFRHINKYYPELAKRTFYVIGDVPRSEYRRLRKIGHVVRHGSIRHRLLFLNAKYIYSSHNHSNFYNAFLPSRIKYYCDLFNYKLVWLQHGITMNGVSGAANRLNVADDYVVTSTNGETKEFQQSEYFNDARQIIQCGLALYDLLDNNPSNIISVMPTWRRWLSGPISPDGEHTTIAGFTESDYYRNYYELLTSKRLTEFLNDNDMQLNFILHAGVDGYYDDFKVLETDRIHILHTEDCSYRRVFSESKLIVTDYSSIAFDFAYLRKPIIYFQFDKQDFFTKHYKQGYYSYDRDGFGEIVDTPAAVIDLITKYAESDFKLKDKYLSRIKRTFKYHDKGACERILRATLPERMLK